MTCADTIENAMKGQVMGPERDSDDDDRAVDEGHSEDHWYDLD